MTQTVSAIFEAGCFRPLSPVNLTEAEKVVITIQTETGDSPELQAWPRIQPLAPNPTVPVISLDEVRAIMANVPNDWQDEIRREREKK